MWTGVRKKVTRTQRGDQGLGIHITRDVPSSGRRSAVEYDSRSNSHPTTDWSTHERPRREDPTRTNRTSCIRNGPRGVMDRNDGRPRNYRTGSPTRPGVHPSRTPSTHEGFSDKPNSISYGFLVHPRGKEWVVEVWVGSRPRTRQGPVEDNEQFYKILRLSPP